MIPIFNTDCPSCLEPVFPEDTSQANPKCNSHRNNQLVLMCGHTYHLTCFRNASFTQKNLIERCWTCRKAIDPSLIPPPSLCDSLKGSWRAGFCKGYGYSPQIIPILASGIFGFSAGAGACLGARTGLGAGFGAGFGVYAGAMGCLPIIAGTSGVKFGEKLGNYLGKLTPIRYIFGTCAAVINVAKNLLYSS